MEKPKSKIAKSKSSNIAITTQCKRQREHQRKSDNGRKKSKSNAEFQTLVVKKRGVYVENKLSLDERAKETKVEELPAKPPPRPRPGSKRFLASVLTILSKSTTATQFPDTEDKPEMKTKKNFAKEPKPDNVGNVKKKPKYKSKVLNKGQIQTDKFEILQSKKEIIHTPSLYSEKSFKDDAKWRPVKPDIDDGQKTHKGDNIVENNPVNDIVREVTEGRKTKKKVKLVDAEPTTLVSEHKDDKLYNFFVDLLETTISVYNLKAEYNAASMPSAISSNIALEMNESVAKKLNVGTEMVEEQKKSKHFYSVTNNDGWNTEQLTDQPPKICLPEASSKSLTKQRKTKSFAFVQRNVIPPPKSKSAVITRTYSQQKNKKKNLLNILKEQLAVDIAEPHNLYQALKVMAKNKKKQKLIRFDTNSKNEGKCMLKRRKIISRRTKSSSKCESELRSSDSAKKTENLRRKALTERNPSNHSLEVYDFDYEVRWKKRVKKEKELSLTYHSSPSNSDHIVRVESETSITVFND